MAIYDDVPERSSSRLSRRGVLGGALGAGMLPALSGVGLPQASANSVEFATLRDRWQAISLGPEVDPSDPDFADGLAAIDAACVEATQHLIDHPERAMVFEDLPFGDGVSSRLHWTYSRLRTMAVAYVTRGATRHGDPELAEQVLGGLRTAYDLLYNETALEYDNWYHWEIGAPLSLVDICVYLYDLIPAAELQNYVRTLDHFNSDPGLVYEVPNIDLPDRVPTPTSGSNLVYLCRNMIVSGLLGQEGAKIALALDRMAPSLAHAKLDLSSPMSGVNNGIYRDGSFIHHLTVPATGTYGGEQLSNLAKILGLVGGSSWGSSVPDVANLFEAVDEGFFPFIYNGHWLECVRERAVTRNRSSLPAVGTIGAILELASGVDDVTARQWRGMVRGAMERHPTFPEFLASQPMARLGLMKDVLNDPAVSPTAEVDGFRVFPRMARAVLRGDGWAYAIAGSSDRVRHYSTMNNENLRGFHTGAGMTYLYTDDNPLVFNDGYWPTANVYGHAGTTVDTRPLEDGAGPTLPTNTWAGGACLDRRVGAFGQELHGLRSQLRAAKSWFCFPDRIVALGAGITDPADLADANPVLTTVEHRNLGVDGQNSLVVNGQECGTEIGWQGRFSDADWARLEDVAGYVFLDGSTTLCASREERTGRWSDVDHQTGGDSELTRRYVTLAFDHGTAPQGATYAYIVLPLASAAETSAARTNPQMEIVSNTDSVQAVWTPGRVGTFMGNYFGAGSAHRFAADGPCSVVAEVSSTMLTVAIADPTQRRDQVQVRVTRGDWATWSAGPLTTVRQQRGATTITVDTSTRDGISHTVTLAR